MEQGIPAFSGPCDILTDADLIEEKRYWDDLLE